MERDYEENLSCTRKISCGTCLGFFCMMTIVMLAAQFMFVW